GGLLHLHLLGPLEDAQVAALGNGELVLGLGRVVDERRHGQHSFFHGACPGRRRRNFRRLGALPSGRAVWLHGGPYRATPWMVRVFAASPCSTSRSRMAPAKAGSRMLASAASSAAGAGATPRAFRTAASSQVWAARLASGASVGVTSLGGLPLPRSRGGGA